MKNNAGPWPHPWLYGLSVNTPVRRRAVVVDALSEDLAAPLDFDDFDPARQRLLGRPDVSEHLAHHFFLSARDLGRLGTMMLQVVGFNCVPAGRSGRA